VRVCGSHTTHTRITGTGPRAVPTDRGVLSLHLEMITARSKRAGAAHPSCHRHERVSGSVGDACRVRVSDPFAATL